MAKEKLDRKAMQAKAEGGEGHIYKIKPSWRTAYIVLGVICLLLVFTFPFAIWLFIELRLKRVVTTNEGLLAHHIVTGAWRWDEIEAFRVQPIDFGSGGFGLAGAVAGSVASTAVAAKTQGFKSAIFFTLKGSRSQGIIPAHMVENSMELVKELEERTGLPVFPRKEAAQA